MIPGKLRQYSKAVLIATIALAAVGVIAELAVTRPPGPVDPETPALRAATEGALRSTSAFAIEPPGTYAGGPLPSPIAVAIRARVSSDIARYFTPWLQARYLPGILAAVDQIEASEWTEQGDIRFDWRDAKLDGDQATVHVTEIGWGMWRGGQFGTDPSKSRRLDWTADWTVSLIRSAGEWRVDELDVHCPGGCG
jgi:hypothetical protein